MSSYDDWKTDPEYGLSHRDLREAELKTEIDNLIEEKQKLRDALEEVLEWARDNQDVVDGDDGQPQPDSIMKIANMVEEALGRGGRYGF